MEKTDERRTLLTFREFSDVDQSDDGSTWWGEINMRVGRGDELYQKLKLEKSVWLIVDLHLEEWNDGRPQCKVVLFSSFKSNKFKGLFGGSGNIRMLYMPPWTLAEAMIQCADVLSSEDAKIISSEDVKLKFEKFGGSARFLFRDDMSNE